MLLLASLLLVALELDRLGRKLFSLRGSVGVAGSLILMAHITTNNLLCETLRKC